LQNTLLISRRFLKVINFVIPGTTLIISRGFLKVLNFVGPGTALGVNAKRKVSAKPNAKAKNAQGDGGVARHVRIVGDGSRSYLLF